MSNMVTVSARVTTAERDALWAEAARTGRTPSEILRRKIQALPAPARPAASRGRGGAGAAGARAAKPAEAPPPASPRAEQGAPPAGTCDKAMRGRTGHEWRALGTARREGAARREGWTHVCGQCGDLWAAHPPQE